MPISKFGQSVADYMENAIQETFPPVESVEPTFQIFVKDLQGKTVTISGVKSSDLLQVVFDKAEDKTGVPADEMRLNYAGKELVRTNTLADYKITKDAELKQVLRLRGGRLPSDVLDTDESMRANLPNLKKLCIFLYQDGRLDDIEVDIEMELDDNNCVNKTLLGVLQSKEEKAWLIVLKTIKDKKPDLLYTDPAQANAPLKESDAERLKDVYDEAIIFFDKVASGSFDDSIKQVFGDGNLATAKQKYANAKAKLIELFDKIDTDYHGDDTETGSGGYAMFDTKIHLSESFFSGKIEGAFVTLVHESMHLGNQDVRDCGYNGSAGYDTMQENQKLVNADHFAEVARRDKGVSSYADKVFTPANLGGGRGIGTVPTIVDTAVRDASEQLRKAWSSSRRLLKYFRESHLKGKVSDLQSILLVKFWSKILGLTFHERYKPSTPDDNTIDLIDLALIEAISRRLAQALQVLPAVKVTDVLTVDIDEQTDPVKLTTRNIINALTKIKGLGDTIDASLKIVQVLVNHHDCELSLEATILEEAYARGNHRQIIAKLKIKGFENILNTNNPHTISILYDGLSQCTGNVFNKFCKAATRAHIKAFFATAFPSYTSANSLSLFIDAIFADSITHRITILTAIDTIMLGYYAFSSADTYIILRGLSDIGAEVTMGTTTILDRSPNIVTDFFQKCASNQVAEIIHLTLAINPNLGIAMMNLLDQPSFDEFIATNATDDAVRAFIAKTCSVTMDDFVKRINNSSIAAAARLIAHSTNEQIVYYVLHADATVGGRLHTLLAMAGLQKQIQTAVRKLGNKSAEFQTANDKLGNYKIKVADHVPPFADDDDDDDDYDDDDDDYDDDDDDDDLSPDHKKQKRDPLGDVD